MLEERKREKRERESWGAGRGNKMFVGNNPYFTGSEGSHAESFRPGKNEM
jgi:hypothetical protein